MDFSHTRGVKKTVNVHEAKTHLSKLLEAVEAGDEIVIAKAGRPVARLLPFDGTRTHRTLGMDNGVFVVPDDFNAPLPDTVLANVEA